MDPTYMLQILKYCNELLSENTTSPKYFDILEVINQLNCIIVSLEDEDEAFMGES